MLDFTDTDEINVDPQMNGPRVEEGPTNSTLTPKAPKARRELLGVRRHLKSTFLKPLLDRARAVREKVGTHLEGFKQHDLTLPPIEVPPVESTKPEITEAETISRNIEEKEAEPILAKAPKFIKEFWIQSKKKKTWSMKDLKESGPKGEETYLALTTSTLATEEFWMQTFNYFGYNMMAYFEHDPETDNGKWHELFEAWCDQIPGKTELAETAVKENEGLVKGITYRAINQRNLWGRRDKINFDLEEILQEGRAALARAAEPGNFDPRTGNKFSTYASKAIKNAVDNCIREAMCSKRMGLTLSLNVPAHDNSKRTKLDLLKDPNTIEDIEEGIALTEMQKLCSEATIGRVVDRKLRTVMPNEIRTCLLEERMMEIFRRRNLFGTHPAQEGETLEEIGESLDVTRERIRQSEAKGVKVMKNIIALLCAKKKGEHSDAPEEVQKYITYKKWLERGLRATEGYIVPQAKMPPSARSIMLDTETFDILIRTNFFLTMDSAPETHEQIAKSIGKTKTYISGQIRKAKEIINNLLELIPEDYLDEKIATEGAGDPFETFDEFQAHQRTALEKLRASIKTESPKEQATQSKLETAA